MVDVTAAVVEAVTAVATLVEAKEWEADEAADCSGDWEDHQARDLECDSMNQALSAASQFQPVVKSVAERAPETVAVSV